MIQEFDTLDELWLNAAYLVFNHGVRMESRDGPTWDYSGFCARLKDPTAHFMFNPARRMSPSYAAAEFIWYLSGEDDIARILPYAPQYERFANDGIAHGAYGKRWLADEDATYQCAKDRTTIPHRTQLDALCALLAVKADSRQAILTCWNAGDLLYGLLGTVKDIPCTLTLQFRVVDGKLNLITNMRSNDIWLGLPYDVFCFTSLQMLVASELGLSLGWYQHQAGSLHCYARNEEKCRKAAAPSPFNTQPLWYMHDCSFLNRIHEVCRAEQHHRKYKTVSKDFSIGGPGSLLTQLAVMAASKWNWEKAVDYITNPAMKSYIRSIHADS